MVSDLIALHLILFRLGSLEWHSMLNDRLQQQQAPRNKSCNETKLLQRDKLNDLSKRPRVSVGCSKSVKVKTILTSLVFFNQHSIGLDKHLVFLTIHYHVVKKFHSIDNLTFVRFVESLNFYKVASE